MGTRKRAGRNDTETEKKTLGDNVVLYDAADKDSEEEDLESFLFGLQPSHETFRHADEDETLTGLEHVPDSELFFFDTGNSLANKENVKNNDVHDSPGRSASSILSKSGTPTPSQPSFLPSKRPLGAVWVDSDDTSLRISIASDKRLRKLRLDPTEDVITGKEYEKRLRKQFETINPVPQWAAQSRKKRKRDEMEVDDDPLRSLSKLANATASIIDASKRQQLAKGTIDIERLRDANQASKTEGDVKSVMFHPSATVSVMLSAGGDRRLKLFNIDGHTNPLLQTIHIPSLPITSAVFHPSGSHILLTGPRPYFYTYNLQSGVCTQSPRGLWGSFTSKVDNVDHSLEKNAFSPNGEILAVAGRRGHIYLVDWTAGNTQVVASLKMNTSVRSIWWDMSSAPDTRELYTLGENSEVYVWDVRSQKCLRRWRDDGAYGSTAIASSPSGAYLAISSKSGVVNVYDSQKPPASNSGALVKSFGNLTTSVSTIHFNYNSEILAMASDVKKDQLRLVHLPSMSVFSNWPTSSTPLGKVTTVDFSHSSEYLAIGNTRGRVLLYNLRHYLNV